MVKVERSFPAPASLEIEKLKAKRSHREQDVIKQLKKDFYSKCYICELKNLTDIQVEHLLPHKNGKDKERQFDWENLFLVCPHCNSIKNKKIYETNIINCCNEDPEQVLNFFFEESTANIVSNDNNTISNTTAKLVTEVFNSKNTGIRTNGSENRTEKLSIEMNVFLGCLSKYNNDKSSKITIRKLKGLLAKESEFAAFKRGYVKSRMNTYSELYKLFISR